MLYTNRILVNFIPVLLLLAWRFHFSKLYLWLPGQFTSKYYPGWACSTIEVPGGGMCEDVVEWKERGLAILTCDGNRRRWNTVMVLPQSSLTTGTFRRSESQRTIGPG
jgi:hypothetical protein